MSRLHDIQMHGVVYAPDANGGPGTPKYELDNDMLNVVWQQALNGAGQAAFTLTRFNDKLADFDYMKDHIKLFRETSSGVRTVFAGKLVKPSEGPKDVIVYCWDYLAFLQRSRTGYRVTYPNKKIGTEIVAAEWALAVATDTSPFAFVATGTIEDPLGLDGVTPITVNSQFGVIDFDRLFTFYALSEMSMANTANTVVFEITREAPHTFNFWKNRSVVHNDWALFYPGNLIDYDLNTGHDELQNDIATVIVDPTTGAQVEYVVSDPVSVAAFRRLQSAVSIKTLYGLNSGSTVNDQQKAAAARILAMSVVTPKLVTAFPRQGEIDVFNGWDLGDQFRVSLQKGDRNGDRLDTYMKIVGIGAQWTPAAGEVVQAYMR